MKISTCILFTALFISISAKCFSQNTKKPLTQESEYAEALENDIVDWYMSNMIVKATRDLSLAVFDVDQVGSNIHVYSRYSLPHILANGLDERDPTILLCPQRSDFISSLMDQFHYRFYIHHLNGQGDEIYSRDCQQKDPVLSEIHGRTIDWRKYIEIDNN